MCKPNCSEDTINVSICIVSYNTKALLDQCIKSIQENTKNISYEIIVVDNNSDDGTQEVLNKFFPEVRAVFNDSNNGFAKASNQAIRIANGEFILLLNPDTYILEGAIDRCYNFIKKQNENDIMTCKILDANGEIQYFFKGEDFFSLKAQFFMHFKLDKLFPKSSLFKKARLKKIDYNKTQQVGYIAGCFMLIRKSFLQKIGLLDETYFLYGEDSDLCHRVKLAGGKVYYFSGAKIIHYGGKSSKQVNLEAHDQYLINRYKFYYNNFGHTKAFVYRSFLAAGAAIRIVHLVPGFLMQKKGKDLLLKNFQTLVWAMGFRRIEDSIN